jgi:ribonuclease G
MIDRILFNDGIGETRAALLEGDVVQEIRIEREERRSRVGDIVLGRVQRVVPSLRAAFVDVGQGRGGFLNARDAAPLGRAKGREADADMPIERLVHEGEAVLVQITKDGYGEKGPRVTAELSLAGRTVALTPAEPGIRVSRKITDVTERERLTRAVGASLGEDDTLGVIVRTAAQGLDEKRLAAEIDSLKSAWAELAAKAKIASPPALLRQDAGLLGRLVRDIFTDKVTHFEVDTTDALQRAHRLAATLCPDLKDRITLSPEGPALFEVAGIEAEIEAALQPRVLLGGGAWISIEPTEGFTAIDVNAGGGVETGSAKSPSMEINLAAAKEIARQIRLRSISGLIVVDFIHVTDGTDSARLTRALEMALGADPVHSRVSAMSEFGLVEITRRREHESLADILETACPTCGGHGHVARLETEAQAILRWAERAARRPGAEVVVPVSGPVAERLTAMREGASLVSRLEARIGKRVRLDKTH